MMPSIRHAAGNRILRLIVVLGFGLSLAACDKCAIPTWQPNKAPGTPLSCHSDAPAPQ